MAKKPKEKKVPTPAAETPKLITIDVSFWRGVEHPVKFTGSRGQTLSHREAINTIAEKTGMTSAEIGEKIGQAKKTVQGWRTGKAVSVPAGLRLKEWLDTDPMTALLVETANASKVQSGGGSHPREASAMSPE